MHMCSTMCHKMYLLALSFTDASTFSKMYSRGLGTSFVKNLSSSHVLNYPLNTFSSITPFTDAILLGVYLVLNFMYHKSNSREKFKDIQYLTSSH